MAKELEVSFLPFSFWLGIGVCSLQVVSAPMAQSGVRCSWLALPFVFGDPDACAQEREELPPDSREKEEQFLNARLSFAIRGVIRKEKKNDCHSRSVVPESSARPVVSSSFFLKEKKSKGKKKEKKNFFFFFVFSFLVCWLFRWGFSGCVCLFSVWAGSREIRIEFESYPKYFLIIWKRNCNSWIKEYIRNCDFACVGGAF